jgi:hypothetical protein
MSDNTGVLCTERWSESRSVQALRGFAKKFGTRFNRKLEAEEQRKQGKNIKLRKNQ